ncbi:hypothetical protein IL306_013073 [Fusarium sp. DS 682]|nr:hypothetical protein IL306_013073 [Fusarium sp. DS 682]
MLTNWFSQPAGARSSTDDPRGPDAEDDTLVMEPDQGNDGKRAYYISEQTSHHPPKSSYFYMAPDHHIRIDGTLKPRSRFLGNSAASLMEGVAFLRLLNRGKDPAKGEQ